MFSSKRFNTRKYKHNTRKNQTRWFSEDLSSEFTRFEVNTETGCMYLKENLELCMRRDERGGSDRVPFSPGVGKSLENTARDTCFMTAQLHKISFEGFSLVYHLENIFLNERGLCDEFPTAHAVEERTFVP